MTAEGMLERINRVKNEGVTVDDFREQWLRTRNFVDDVFLKSVSRMSGNLAEKWVFGF